MFQLHEQSQTRNSRREHLELGDAANDQEGTVDDTNTFTDPESPVVNRELRRVTATLVQTLRSEVELMRLEAETDD